MITGRFHIRARIIVSLALSLTLGSGCAQLKLPKATPPGELPTLARVSTPAPDFTAMAQDRSITTLEDLKGKPAVVIGVDPAFSGEVQAWVDEIAKYFGKHGDRYRLLLLVEDARIGVLDKLSLVIPGEMQFLASGDFAIAYGFKNLAASTEGPHVVVISAEGVLLQIVDGPLSPERRDEVCFALRGMLTPVESAQ